MNLIPKAITKIFVICAILSFILVFIIQSPAMAFENGTGDLDTSCTNCHSNGGSGTIEVIVLPHTMEANQTNINFSVTVNIGSMNSDVVFAGVMLLTGEGENIKNAGWEITSTPNNNEYPYNYNEKTWPNGDTTFTWILTAPPTADSYTIKARMLYEGGEAYFLESQEKTVSVIPQFSGDHEQVEVESLEDYSINMKALGFGALVGMSSVMIVMIFRRR